MPGGARKRIPRVYAAAQLSRLVEKADLRRVARERRETLGARDRSEWSREICARARELPEYRDADVVACYVSIGAEVATRALLQAALLDAKRVAVPVSDLRAHRLDLARFDGFHGMETGAFGVREPRPVVKVDAKGVDVVFVPGLAFDARGHRLGYGRGYFDRLLAGTSAARVGLAYEAQLVDRVPDERHDIPVEVVVTEKGTIRIGA